MHGGVGTCIFLHYFDLEYDRWTKRLYLKEASEEKGQLNLGQGHKVYLFFFSHEAKRQKELC